MKANMSVYGCPFFVDPFDVLCWFFNNFLRKASLSLLNAVPWWIGAGGIKGRQEFQMQYRVTLVVAYLGSVDFDLDVPSSCPPDQTVLPKSYLQTAEHLESTQPR